MLKTGRQASPACNVTRGARRLPATDTGGYPRRAEAAELLAPDRCGRQKESGRGERIRTSGLYVPNVALYQAKLRPDIPCGTA